jgi:hypothetical protein
VSRVEIRQTAIVNDGSGGDGLALAVAAVAVVALVVPTLLAVVGVAFAAIAWAIATVGIAAVVGWVVKAVLCHAIDRREIRELRAEAAAQRPPVITTLAPGGAIDARHLPAIEPVHRYANGHTTVRGWS